MRSASVCPHCGGSGKVVGKRPPGVGPDGMVKKEETIKIKIRWCRRRKLYDIERSRKSKCFWSFRRPHCCFRREDHLYFWDGENLILELHISFPLAVLGGKIEIPTLHGKVGLKFPKGIQSGQILRLKGKGFPRIRSNHCGDQLVKIQINTPKKYQDLQKD